jgi:hypothetical protein
MDLDRRQDPADVRGTAEGEGKEAPGRRCIIFPQNILRMTTGLLLSFCSRSESRHASRVVAVNWPICWTQRAELRDEGTPNVGPRRGPVALARPDPTCANVGDPGMPKN